MKRILNGSLLAGMVALVLAACGGGGGGSATPPPSQPPAFHNVTLSWTANREKGVNSAGGGYTVWIDAQAPIDVPFNAASGVTPTAVTTSLYTGAHNFTVRAYAALDSSGGATGSTSTQSSISFVVP